MVSRRLIASTADKYVIKLRIRYHTIRYIEYVAFGSAMLLLCGAKAL